MNRVTADSNVWVSALIWGGKPLQLLELALTGELEVALSPDLLDETLRIFRDKFNMSPADLARAEGYMLKCARVVTPTEMLDVVQADPDDNRVIECAVAAFSETIVSGDLDLLRMKSFRAIRIMKVSDFLSELQARDR